ncbi:MAG: thioredoxin family protein [Bacteroidetes bacterium]|nr:MAG: thioredoxin family protein [Bacteroidota bacterium]
MQMVNILKQLLILVLALGLLSGKGKKQKPTILWLSIAEMERRQLTQERPVVVKVFTKWCVYCKQMDATTWVNDSVVAYVNRHYYAIKFDAELKTPISWAGETFEYNPRYKINMLTAKLLNGNITFPSTAILPAVGSGKVLTGFKTAQELQLALKQLGPVEALR